MKWFLGAFLVGLMIGGALMTYSYLAGRYDCHVNWRDSGMEYRYKIRGGCQVQKGTGWLPADKYRFE